MAVVTVSAFMAGCSSATPVANPTTITADATTTTAPTTTAAPTTTVADTTTTTISQPNADAVAFVQDWAAHLNDGNHESAADMVVAAEHWDAPGESDEEREMNTRIFFEIFTLLGSEFSVDTCQTLSSGITRCPISRSSAEFESIYPDPETNIFSVSFADTGVLAYASLAPVQTDPWWLTYGIFRSWVSDTYGRGPDSPFIKLFVDPEPAQYPDVLAEQVAIWRAETSA